MNEIHNKSTTLPNMPYHEIDLQLIYSFN